MLSYGFRVQVLGFRVRVHVRSTTVPRILHSRSPGVSTIPRPSMSE